MYFKTIGCAALLSAVAMQAIQAETVVVPGVVPVKQSTVTTITDTTATVKRVPVSTVAPRVGYSLFAGVIGGPSYLRVKPKADAQNTMMVADTKAVHAMGGRAGVFFEYGYTYASKVYVGARIEGGMDYSKPKWTANRSYKVAPAIPVVINGFADPLLFETQVTENSEIEFRSRAYYGGVIEVGYMFHPQILGYVLAGAEGRVYQIASQSQVIHHVAGASVKADDQTVDVKDFTMNFCAYRDNESKTLDGFTFQKQDLKCANAPYGVVGIGSRFFLNPRMFFGIEFKALFGTKKEWKVAQGTYNVRHTEPEITASADENKEFVKQKFDEVVAAANAMFINTASATKLHFKTNSQNYIGSVSFGYRF